MVLERSSGFAVTAVDEKAVLGQWYWKGPDLLSLSLKRLAETVAMVSRWYWKRPDLLLMSMERLSSVGGISQ